MKLERIAEVIIGIPFYFPFGFIFHQTHLEMVKEDRPCVYLKRATFRDFYREFKKHEWQRLFGYSSIETKDGFGYFHASIIRFGNVGYLMTPLGYFFAVICKSLVLKKLKKTSYHKRYID